ncbi:MAG: stalk domain-containing protein [Ignavibacteriales bacterium]
MKRFRVGTVVLLLAVFWGMSLFIFDHSLLASPADNYIDMGNTAREDGDLDKAIEYFDKAIQADGKSVEAYDKKAWCLKTEGYTNEAVKMYIAALKVDPGNIPVLSRMADTLYKAGLYEEALSLVDQILKLDPKYDTLFYNRACLYCALEDRDAALKALKEAIDIRPEFKVDADNDPDFKDIKNLKEFKSLTAIEVRIDGTKLSTDVAPVMIKGSLMLPARAVFEALGASVNWNGAAKTLTGAKGKTSVVLKINGKSGQINGVAKPLSVPATMSGGRILVPVRFVSEAFGAEVDWDADQKAAFITTVDKSVLPPDDVKGTLTSMDQNVVKLPIDGMWANPYSMTGSEGIMFFVAKNPESLNQFQSLDKETQKKYMNDYMQANWGELVGCQKVQCIFVYDGRRYAAMSTTHLADSKDLKIALYRNGMYANVVAQDKANDKYTYYYGSASKPDRFVFDLEAVPTEKDIQIKKRNTLLVPYENAEYGIKMMVPAGWKDMPTDELEFDEDVLCFADPTNQNVVLMISGGNDVSGMPQDVNIEMMTDMMIANFKTDMEQFKLLDSKTIKINGNSFVEITFTSLDVGYITKATFWFGIMDDKLYFLGFIGDPLIYELYISEIKGSIDNFKVLEEADIL